jgi:hypothetical protein
MSRSWIPLLVISGVVAVFLFISYQIALIKNISPDALIRDPNYVNNSPFYVGSISILGVILWSATASSCFLGAIIRNDKSRKFWFLITAGAYTTFLGLDDAFELHQVLFPKYLHLNEAVIYSLYISYIVAWSFYYFSEIVNHTDFPIFIAALLCMVISVFPAHVLDLNFIEDSFKFLGIVFWLTYFARTSIHFVVERSRPA